MYHEHRRTFQSRNSIQTLFHVSASAVLIVESDRELEEIARGMALIIVPGVSRQLVFGSVATHVLAQSEEAALERAMGKAHLIFPPSQGWGSHVVNANSAGKFHPFSPAFG